MGRRPRRHQRSATVFRALLRVLPREMRRAHGREMVQAFRDSLREATSGGGVRGWIGVWLGSAVDLASTAVLCRMEDRRERKLAARRARALEGASGAGSSPGRGALHGVGPDIRIALRRLARAPLFTVTVLATLGAGIGVNTATFQVLNEVLREPVPYPEPERLVFLTTEAPELRIVRGKVSPDAVWGWQADVGSLEGVATFDMGVFSLAGDAMSEGEPVSGLNVETNLFDVLGMGPEIGRGFLPEDGFAGQDDVAVLGHGLWQRRYAGARDVLGRDLVVDGRAYTIVGVLPEDFEDPLGGLQPAADLYLPLVVEPGSPLARSQWLFAVGRLARGVSPATAAAELSAHWSGMSARNPEEYAPEMTVGVTDLTEATSAGVAVPLKLALAAALFVLLIVCANLAGLLLARGADSGRDVAIRTAMGGSRFRVVRAAVVESLVLAGLGGLVGLGVSLSFASVVERLVGLDAPRLAQLSLDGSVFAFVAGVSILCGIAFGVFPAIALSRNDPQRVLKESGALGGGRRRRRLQDALVVSQMAFAVVLVVGAGLALKSFGALSQVDPGFDTEGVLTFEVRLPSGGYPEVEDILNFHSGFGQALAGVPRMEVFGATNMRPLGTRWGCRAVMPEGGAIPETAAEWPCGESHATTPGYFEAMGVPAVRGRRFTTADGVEGSAPVAIVSAALADRLWPDEDPVGRQLIWASSLDADDPPPPLEVVGVVESMAHIGLNLPPAQTVYQPFGQAVDRRMTYAVKVGGDPSAAVPAVRDALRRMDPTLQLRQTTPMGAVVEGAVQPYLISGVFLAALAITGLLLSMTGVYALISGRVSRQVREIGLRIALGADRSHVVGSILRRGLRLGAIATVVGVAVSMVLGRSARDLLYEVQPTDPLVMSGVAAIVVAVAALAAYVPARRAARVDPTLALREE